MVDAMPHKCTYQIGKRHLIMTCILLCIVMICFSKEYDNLTWKIEKKALQYGEDLRLSCQVDDCCKKSAGWGKWTSNDKFETLIIDVKGLYNEKKFKYDGERYETGFSLIIRNITRNDLNIQYSCTYGFLIGKKIKLLEKDALYGPTEQRSTGPTEQRSTVTTDIISRPHVIIMVIVILVLAAFVCLLVCVIYNVCIYKLKRKKGEKAQHIDVTLHVKFPSKSDSIQPTDLPNEDAIVYTQVNNGSNGANDTLVTTVVSTRQTVRPRRNRSTSIETLLQY